MRWFKLLIISITILFLLVTAISLFIPFHVRISRATNVRATPTEVWRQVDDMSTWENWNPFFSSLSPGKVSFPGRVGGKPGAMQVGGTTIEWKEMKPDEHIAIMQKPGYRPILNGWKCISHPGADSTTVQWYMDFHLRWYPWEKFASLLFEQSYGIKMEQGLGNIKKMVETDRTSFN
ncbi:MAG: SRPBCC family protein [Chitinophagaceae bacterium]